jgi:hypothetical protein
MNKYLVVFIIIGLFVSCGVSKIEHENVLSENNKLKEDVERLNTELDQYRNGSERTVALIKQYLGEENLNLARESINTLSQYHPEDLDKKEVINLISLVEKKEKEEIARKEAEEKERIRLANLNNTGIWRVGKYVDSFGEPTDEGYITNREYIKGTFSNTATQNSELNVKFLITNLSDVNIQLYEYAGNNPVKAYSADSYSVQIQDRDGNRNRLKATNYSDRLSFGNEASRIIHNVLMKGGNIKLNIVEDDTPTTKYQFEINNADWYENAYRILTGK